MNEQQRIMTPKRFRQAMLKRFPLKDTDYSEQFQDIFEWAYNQMAEEAQKEVQRGYKLGFGIAKDIGEEEATKKTFTEIWDLLEIDEKDPNTDMSSYGWIITTLLRYAKKKGIKLNDDGK